MFPDMMHQRTVVFFLMFRHRPEEFLPEPGLFKQKAVGNMHGLAGCRLVHVFREIGIILEIDIRDVCNLRGNMIVPLRFGTVFNRKLVRFAIQFGIDLGNNAHRFQSGCTCGIHLDMSLGDLGNR